MTSQAKAEKFADAAEREGWEVELIEVVDPYNDDEEPGDRWEVVARKDGQTIEIFWVKNMLTETPKYTYAGATLSLHNAATATRQLSLKPDVKRAYKRAARKTSAVRVTDDTAHLVVQQQLPFDIYEDSDATILKAIRGATLVVWREMLGTIETIFVPRASNMNLDHFDLTENPGGRAMVNFIDQTGNFRSIYLDCIRDLR